MSNGVSHTAIPVGTGLRARQVEERRQRLVGAARALLRNRSGCDFSMLDLAKEAGFSPATPYNLFGTKAAVLSAVYAADIAAFQNALNQLLKDDPVSALLGTAELIGVQIMRRAAFYRNLAASMSGLAMDEVRPAMVELNNVMLEPLVEFMADRDSFERWIAPSMLTGHLTRQLEAVFFHWAREDWSSERLVAELQFGFGMALLGALRSSLRQALGNGLKAIAPKLRPVTEPSVIKKV